MRGAIFMRTTSTIARSRKEKCANKCFGATKMRALPSRHSFENVRETLSRRKNARGDFSYQQHPRLQDRSRKNAQTKALVQQKCKHFPSHHSFEKVRETLSRGKQCAIRFSYEQHPRLQDRTRKGAQTKALAQRQCEHLPSHHSFEKVCETAARGKHTARYDFHMNSKSATARSRKEKCARKSFGAKKCEHFPSQQRFEKVRETTARLKNCEVRFSYEQHPRLQDRVRKNLHTQVRPH